MDIKAKPTAPNKRNCCTTLKKQKKRVVLHFD